MPEPTRHIPTPAGFLMVLRQGDDLFARLAALMREQTIPSAFLSGFGFAGQVTFGFFDYEKKDYDPKTLTDLEVTNLTGTLAWKDGAPSIHAHATAGDKGFQTFGGHLLALEVGRGSMEIAITIIPTRLERAVDEAIGANVLQL